MSKYPELKYTFSGSYIPRQREGRMVNQYNPFHNLIVDNKISEFTTSNLSQEINIDKSFDMEVQESYDGSVNIILNNDYSSPKLINSRFSVLENDTFEVPDHIGNKDTNLYDDNDLALDTSLYKTISRLPSLDFNGLNQFGQLRCGSYHFYFKFTDNDDNETDFVLESSVVMVHIGNINDPFSIRMGMGNEQTDKAVEFTLHNIDPAYDFIKVFFSRSTSGSDGADIVEIYEILDKFPIIDRINSKIIIYGTENVEVRTADDINIKYLYCDSAKAQTKCQNRLFFGNINKPQLDYESFKQASLSIIPSISTQNSIGYLDNTYNDDSYVDWSCGYYNVKNIYYRLGYWPLEYYRFGVVWILNNFTLSPVFDVMGIDFSQLSKEDSIPQSHIADEYGYLDAKKLFNNFGVTRVPNKFLLGIGDNPIGINFKISDANKSHFEFLKANTQGFFIVRQKRMPLTIAQGVVIGKTKDGLGNLPCIKTSNQYFTDSFVKPVTDNNRKLYTLGKQTVNIQSYNVQNKAVIVPDATVRPQLFNQIFTSNTFKYRQYAKGIDSGLLTVDNKLYFVKQNTKADDSSIRSTKFTMVNSGTSLTTAGKEYFSARPGKANDLLKFADVQNDWTKIGSEHDNKLPTNSFQRINTANYICKTLMNDLLVRGLFGTYVGTEDEVGKFSDVINILRGDFEDSPKGRFVQEQLRKEDKSPYYAISDRYYTTELKGGIDCYRGDCFICPFTQRIIRNFIDPELPTNDKIVSPLSWHNNFVVITKFRSDNPRVYINEVLDIFKIKMGRMTELDSANATFSLDPTKGILGLPAKVSIIEDFNSDLRSLSQKDEVHIAVPSDANYEKLGSAGEFFDVPNAWREHGINQINRSDVNAVGLGHWITVRVLSNQNLCMRDIDLYNSQEQAEMGVPRSFYPLQKISTSSQYKLEESSRINGATNKVLSERYNHLLPEVPYIKQRFDTRIAYSDIAITDRFKNGFRVFRAKNYQDYPKTYGSLTDIKEFSNNIIAVMEHGIMLIPVQERTMQGSGDGGEIHIISDVVLPKTPMIISPTFGSTWKESIIKTDRYIYGVDTSGKKIWRTSGKDFEILSDLKLQKFLNDNIVLKEWDQFCKVGIRNVKSHYNAFKKDIMFTFYNGDVKWNLCFNELLNTFVTLYSWYPSFSANINNIFLSFDLEDTRNIVNDAHYQNNYKSYINNNEEGYNNKLPQTIQEVENATIFSLAYSSKSIQLFDSWFWEDNKYFILETKSENGEFSYTLKYNVKYADEIIKLKSGMIRLYIDNKDIVYLRVRIEQACVEFWKHGQSGIFDGQGIITPTKWYDKQHPFEVEIVVAVDAMLQKLYYNLMLISNKAEPESFTYEIVGESYEWFKYKPLIEWLNSVSEDDRELKRKYQEALTLTLEELQEIYGDSGFPEMPQFNKKHRFVKLPYLRNIHRDSLGKETTKYNASLTDIKLLQDDLLLETRLQVTQPGLDIKKHGRILGNMEYLEDCWKVSIQPIAFKYAYMKNGRLRFTSDDKQSRIRDKYCKIRIRYTGEDLVILQGIKTLFDYSYS